MRPILHHSRHAVCAFATIAAALGLPAVEQAGVGDLTGDGHPDLGVAEDSSDQVAVLLGDGAGSFGTATDFAVGRLPESLAIGDFDGDGKPDLAVANYIGGSVSELLGDGTGS